MSEIDDQSWTGLYRAGQHGGGDCVYFQATPAPQKSDPRVCIAFPAVNASGAVVAQGIINALNAAQLGDSARATGWLVMPADHDAGWNTVRYDAIPSDTYECAGCGGQFIAREEHTCPGGVLFVLDKPGTFEPSEHRFMLDNPTP